MESVWFVNPQLEEIGRKGLTFVEILHIKPGKNSLMLNK